MVTETALLQPRRRSRQIQVGSVAVGGDAPISVQSMTNTDTCDVEATLGQIRALAAAGADLVRISVPTLEAAEAFARIRAESPLPLISDIHFDHRIALRVLELGVDCLRINPGNIGREDRVRDVVESARDHGVPIRIGVNAGSLEKEIQRRYGEPSATAMVESALRHIEILDRLNFPDFKVSLKASSIAMTVVAYRLLARQIEQPLHLGITEAGGLRSGSVKSAIGIGLLLAEGIGDTLRVSLAADPVQEVKVGFDILKGLQLRSRGINFIACPTCSRQKFDVITTVNTLEERLDSVAKPLDVAIIGCVVNGPGEAKEAALGIAGGEPNLLYRHGEVVTKVENRDLLTVLESAIRQELEREEESAR
ncbi:MAG: flavodoxin-dependent (E)-4-hydroxy-3-methylbut-2-enyl-diphosphate synthase [Gammaproteobacteria bacterium]|nr:flavodoxin-dependent (E)-4-hydroxy-3-methylbut-2-enyl-diphosphate synthase [Gammaproteobacteria bacterium]